MAQLGGIYRATVVTSIDPERRGRLQVLLAGWGNPVWAEAAGPLGPWRCDAEPPPPAAGAPVWVMFEDGDAAFPVVIGRVQGPAQTGPLAAEAGLARLQFPGGEIAFDGNDPQHPAIAIALAEGPSLRMSAEGIELDNGKGARIALHGPVVSINDGALEIT
ncbi:MAG: phage baseplate assembly protein V [Novosphingobium sp.]